MNRKLGRRKRPVSSAKTDILTTAIEYSGIANDSINEQRQTPSMSMSSAPKKSKTLPQKTLIEMYCDAVTKMMESKEEPRPENPEVGWFRSLLPHIELLSPMDLLAFKTEGQQTLYQYLKYPGSQGHGQYPNMQGQGQAAQQRQLPYASQNQRGKLKHQ